MARKIKKNVNHELSRYIIDETTNKLNGSHCKIWQGPTNNSGYGQTWIDGSMKYAHRISYENTHGKVPAGKEIGHLCHNKLCMNPDHLHAMTHQENIQHGYDTKQPRKKIVTLTSSVREHIINNESHMSKDSLAKKYNVHVITITRLFKKGK